MPASGARSRLRALVALAAVVALGTLAVGCSSTDEEPLDTEAERTTPQEAEVEQPLDAQQEQGRDLFVEKCGSCHTLEAAGTQGSIGPNLDEAPVDEAEVLEAIENGGRGTGNMPADLVSGQDAQAVAAFVAGSGP